MFGENGFPIISHSIHSNHQQSNYNPANSKIRQTATAAKVSQQQVQLK
jgi:hypothetical protein